MQCIVSDMTAFYVKGIYHELTLYMDLWNNEIVSHSLSAKRGDRMTYISGLNGLIDIKKMMNTLPAPQREVVYMRYFQQLSFKEIADLTGVSINTSLGRMRYALINLRKMAKDNKIELALCEY